MSLHIHWYLKGKHQICEVVTAWHSLFVQKYLNKLIHMRKWQEGKDKFLFYLRQICSVVCFELKYIWHWWSQSITNYLCSFHHPHWIQCCKCNYRCPVYHHNKHQDHKGWSYMDPQLEDRKKSFSVSSPNCLLWYFYTKGIGFLQFKNSSYLHLQTQVSPFHKKPCSQAQA